MIEVDDYEITDILTQYEADISHLPFTDEMAWDKYPFLRWAYNKRALITYLDQTLPKTDLWVHKPEINFWGLGRGTSVEQHPRAVKGFYAMPFIYGDLLSTDFLIQDGQFLGSMTFKTKNNKEDIHNKILWEGVKTPSEELKMTLHKFATEHLEFYTGMLNVEYIDGIIIEMHLRPSAQFYWAQANILADWINVMSNLPREHHHYSARGLGSLVIREELNYDEVPEGVHCMRLNPSDDLAAANKRQYLVSGPMSLIRTLTTPDSSPIQLV